MVPEMLLSGKQTAADEADQAKAKTEQVGDDDELIDTEAEGEDQSIPLPADEELDISPADPLAVLLAQLPNCVNRNMIDKVVCLSPLLELFFITFFTFLRSLWAIFNLFLLCRLVSTLSLAIAASV